jgi:hypothetical protein
MSDRNPLILQVHLAGADPYQLGDEIWQQSLDDAIRAEAEIVADHARPRLPKPSPAARIALRDRADLTAGQPTEVASPGRRPRSASSADAVHRMASSISTRRSQSSPSALSFLIVGGVGHQISQPRCPDLR